ncbi:BspA family leucine-rich repeat surface protein [Isoptericola sp. F-RaC21]|uniref:BspA family leucine-rich repeat surface protein n=1 Tax=Isoptericola sp. F-RaC21 TaxID=3141452 RepID=UPI00315C4836
MPRQARSTNPLRVTLLAVAASAAVLLALPGTGAFAAWNDSTPIGGTVATGSLGIDEDALAGGDWTEGGTAFDPTTDTLTAGTTLTSTLADVPVTAVGDNLEASFEASGAKIPAPAADHVSVDVASTPAPVKGADSDTDGHQTVDLVLTVAADADLSDDVQKVDLTHLAVTLTNGHAWTDTATLDAGTLTTGGPHPSSPGGTMTLSFDLSLDDDGRIGFYLDDPDATIFWDTWGSDGTEHTTAARDGLNEYDYAGTGKTSAWVRIQGTFDGFGSADQTTGQIGSLTHVEGWSPDTGAVSASHAFENATHLVHVAALPATLTDTSAAFRNAATTESAGLYLEPWDSSHVTTMAHMFEGAGTFDEYQLDWDTSRVTDMTSMFAGATTFDGNVARWDTSQVTTMAHMFDGAEAFSQDLSGWDVDGVDDHAGFADDSGLTPEQLPRWDDGAAPAKQATTATDAGGPTPATEAGGDAAAASEPEVPGRDDDAATPDVASPSPDTSEDDTVADACDLDPSDDTGAGANGSITTGSGTADGNSDHEEEAPGCPASDADAETAPDAPLSDPSPSTSTLPEAATDGSRTD